MKLYNYAMVKVKLFDMYNFKPHIITSIVLVFCLRTAVGQLPEEQFWLKAYKNGQLSHFKFDPKDVWSDFDRLAVSTKDDKNLFIYSTDYDQIILDGKEIYIKEVNGQSIFLEGILFHGSVRLYANKDHLGRDWFYIKTDTLPLQKIERHKLQQFLNSNFYGKNQLTDQKIDNMLLPAKMSYVRSFFHDLFYSYNHEADSPFQPELEKSIQYNSIKGVTIGTVNGGFSIGVYSHVPINRFYRFESELNFSTFKGTSSERFAGVFSFEEETTYKVISIPFGFRYITNPLKSQFSIFGGAVGRYTHFSFKEIDALNTPETTTTQLRGGAYFGMGYHHVFSFRNALGMDLRYIISSPINLFEIMLKLSV